MQVNEHEYATSFGCRPGMVNTSLPILSLAADDPDDWDRERGKQEHESVFISISALGSVRELLAVALMASRKSGSIDLL